MQCQIQNLIFISGSESVAITAASGGGGAGPEINDRVTEAGEPRLDESSEQRIIE
jgi:hypothetical protein